MGQGGQGGDPLIGQGGLYASLYKAYEENAIGVSIGAAPDAAAGAEPPPAAAIELSAAV